MQRIRNNRTITKIEHYHPKNGTIENDLNYGNLLGVCSGGQGSSPKLQHCDTLKADTKITINPLNRNVENQVFYKKDGRIYAKDKTIEKDLKETLNLNLESLRDRRKAVLDIAIQRLQAKKEKGTWTKSILQQELKKYTTKNKQGQFKEFCQIVIADLNKRIERLKK